MSGDGVLRRQILHDGVGAALAELVVVLGAAGGVGAAGDLNDVALGVGQRSGEGIELLLVVLGEDGLVEAEVDGGIADGLVVIEAGDYTGQRIGAMNGVVGGGFSLASGGLSTLSILRCRVG